MILKSFQWLKKTHDTYHYVSDDDEDDNAWPYCQNSHVNLELLTNKTRKKIWNKQRKLLKQTQTSFYQNIQTIESPKSQMLWHGC